MTLRPVDADLLEDLLAHDGFKVIEEHLARLEKNAQRLVDDWTTEFAETQYHRGRLSGLRSLNREALSKLVRDAPGGSDGR